MTSSLDKPNSCSSELQRTMQHDVPAGNRTGRCVSCSQSEKLRWYPIHCFRTSKVASDSMTNGAAAVRQTTYVNRTTYHGLLNTSAQVCDRCEWKKRLRIVAFSATFIVGALVLFLFAWRLLLISALLAWVGVLRLQAWKTAGARVAAKRSKRQLAARGYPYTRIGHIHASYPKVSCDPPHCDGSVGRAETQGIHTVSGFV